MKRILSLILAALMLAAMFAGCAGNDAKTPSNELSQNTQKDPAAPAASEPTPVRWIGVDTAPKGMDEVVKAVNEKLQADGLNLAFQPEFIPRDVRDQKINAMFNAGDSAELIHIMENRSPSSALIAKGMLLPLDDLLAEYGQDMLKNIDEEVWKSCRVNGQTYTIPAYWKDGTKTGIGAGNETGVFPVRADKIKALGLEMPTTAREFIDTMKAVKEAWGEDGKDAYIWNITEPSVATVWLNREYDSWPFYVSYNDDMIRVTNTGEVEAWIETEEFKQNCKYYQEMYQANLIHPDFLSLPYEESERYINSSKWLVGGNVEPPDERCADAPELERDFILLHPEKPIYWTTPVLNVQAVLATSKHPEAGVQFLNWLYSSQENHQLLTCGIEGVHYTNPDVEAHTFERILDETGLPLYEFPEWQMAFKDFRLIDTTNLMVSEAHKTEYIDVSLNHAENAETPPNFGFTFDPAPVDTEYKNCIAEMSAVIYPIKFGIQDYDTYFPAALQRMKDAGLDKVVDEYRAQFEAWQAANK